MLYSYLPGGTKRALAAIKGGTLDPADVTKYVTPLLIPPVMPRAGTLTMPGGKPADYYEISMRQFTEQILPAGLPATTVWGYGAVKSASKKGLLLHHAPSLTIESKWNRPVRVKWINELVDGNGHYLPHLLPVDQTLHWANPPGGTTGRDMRPTFETTPGPYTGPVPIVDPPPRRGRSGRRERRLRRGLVPTGGEQHPGRLRDRRHLAHLLQEQGEGQVRCGLGRRVLGIPVPEQPARVDAVVPRPRARHDSSQRVRRAGGLLHRSRWARRREGHRRQPLRHHRCSPQPGAERRGHVPAQQDLLRDPDRDPGPVVQ